VPAPPPPPQQQQGPPPPQQQQEQPPAAAGLALSNAYEVLANADMWASYVGRVADSLTGEQQRISDEQLWEAVCASDAVDLTREPPPTEAAAPAHLVALLRRTLGLPAVSGDPTADDGRDYGEM
jgi:hypothetical protein